MGRFLARAAIFAEKCLCEAVGTPFNGLPAGPCHATHPAPRTTVVPRGLFLPGRHPSQRGGYLANRRSGLVELGRVPHEAVDHPLVAG